MAILEARSTYVNIDKHGAGIAFQGNIYNDDFTPTFTYSNRGEAFLGLYTSTEMLYEALKNGLETGWSHLVFWTSAYNRIVNNSISIKGAIDRVKTDYPYNVHIVPDETSLSIAIGIAIPPVVPPVIPPVVPTAVLPIITPDDAAAGIQAGKQYWIKCTLPLLDLLPGFPYFEGIPILPGFRISDKL